MNGDVSVEEGSIVNLEQVMSVMTLAFDPKFGEGWNLAQCSGILCLPGSLLLVARINGAIVGFTLVRSVAEEAELLLLAVTPVARRYGVGGKLVTKMIEQIRLEGAKRLFLEVRSCNPAISLYERMGFLAVGQRPSYYRGANGERFDAVTYRLNIVH
jgi:[ribosomal protein S18]-alanine N-acetyltransferase